MGLVIGITACCCAYCAIKKKKKQRKMKRLEKNKAAEEEENDYDAEAEIPVEQNMIPDYIDDGTEDELNVGYPLQPDGKQVGMDNDRPPPSYYTPSVPKGAVLEEMDETGVGDIGGRKHSSKKVKYSHLADSETANGVDTTEPAPKTTKSDEKENTDGVTMVTEGDTFIQEVVDKMAEIEEEGAFEGGGKKQSSKKYKYSPLKGSESDRKRVKSGDSHKEHHQEEIRMSWSNDMYIDEPPTEV